MQPVIMSRFPRLPDFILDGQDHTVSISEIVSGFMDTLLLKSSYTQLIEMLFLKIYGGN